MFIKDPLMPTKRFLLAYSLEYNQVHIFKGLRAKTYLNTLGYRSLMSEATFRKLWPRMKLSPTKCRLCLYSKEPIPVARSIQVNVKYKNQSEKLPLVRRSHSLGEKLADIVLDWKEIHCMKKSSLQEVLAKHEEAVFEDRLGTLKGGSKAGSGS